MGEQRRIRASVAWFLLGVLVCTLVFGGGFLVRRQSSPKPTEVVLRIPTAVPSPTPTPLPTRDPAQAKAQDEAASRALRLLVEVAAGGDPYSLPQRLRTPATIAICPYGCDRAPRLTRFAPDAVPQWSVTRSITPYSNSELRTALRAPLSGTATLLHEDNTTEQLTLTGSVTVSVSRQSGRGWEPEVIRIDPPLVPERGAGDPLPTVVSTLGNPSTPAAATTDLATGLEMPGAPPAPDTVAIQQELANKVMQSISTLAAGSPLPYRYTPEVEAQLQQIVSRYAQPGLTVMGLSLEPIEWERVEVRDENTLELVDPDDTAAMVGYLSGTVWLQDTQGNRKPSPLDPTSEHLVVSLHRRAGAWVVTHVSDGKVDTHSPEEVKAP